MLCNGVCAGKCPLINLETAFDHAKTQRRKEIQTDAEQSAIIGQVSGLI